MRFNKKKEKYITDKGNVTDTLKTAIDSEPGSDDSCVC